MYVFQYLHICGYEHDIVCIGASLSQRCCACKPEDVAEKQVLPPREIHLIKIHVCACVGEKVHIQNTQEKLQKKKGMFL